MITIPKKKEILLVTDNLNIKKYISDILGNDEDYDIRFVESELSKAHLPTHISPQTIKELLQKKKKTRGYDAILVENNKDLAKSIKKKDFSGNILKLDFGKKRYSTIKDLQEIVKQNHKIKDGIDSYLEDS